MNTIAPESRPIGYWLVHLHKLTEDEFSRLLAAEGLQRRHWQCMNTLSKQAENATDLSERLSHFRGTGEIEFDQVLTDLKARGWIGESHSGRISLTPDGVAGHAALADITSTIRQRMMAGLSETDYVATVTNLARMADSLTQTVAAQPTSPALVKTFTVRHRVDDLDTAVPFYERLTGQGAQRFAFAGAQLAAIGPILLFSGPDEAVERISAVAATVSAPDLPATITTLRQWGAEVLADISATPNGHRAVVKHPDGGVFEYVGA